MTENILQYSSKGVIINTPDLNKYKKYVVTIITNNKKAQGVVYVSGENLYIICAAHILDNENIYMNCLFKNVNNSGSDRLLKLQTIGFERTSDVAILLYFANQNSGFILDNLYYSGISLVSLPAVYTSFYYNISTIGDMSDLEVQKVVLKNPNFYGDTQYLVPPSILFEGELENGSSGSPVFDSLGNFFGIAASVIRDTDLNQIVSTFTVDLINYIVQFNWREFGSKITNIYDLGNYLKRSVRYGFMGMELKQYDIVFANKSYYLTMERFRETLPDINLRKTGGLLVTRFIHGYNNVEKDYVFNPFQPIYTGFKIENPFKNANIYKYFFQFNTGPIILVSITYYDSIAQLQDYESTGVYRPPEDFYVKNYLGKYDGQKSIFNFIYRGSGYDNVQAFYFHKDPVTLPPIPFSIEYLYNDGKNWNYGTESVLPFNVKYLNENNKEITQSSIELPYPLYGADVKLTGKDRFVPLDANIVSSQLTTDITLTQTTRGVF